MKETPILFSGPMVAAILAKKKSMARRVCVPRHDDKRPCGHYQPELIGGVWYMLRHCEHGSEGRSCPYGGAGDRLWVRETWQAARRWDGCKPSDIDEHSPIQYAAGGFKTLDAWDDDEPHFYGVKRPSIYMPRWACRITLEITDVRAERLQDITQADAIAEGTGSALPYYDGEHTTGNAFINAFVYLWDSINDGRKDKQGQRLPYAWNDNPYVWVVSFKMLATETRDK